MAMENKVELLNRIKLRLASEVTAADMDKILKALMDEMDGYDVTKTAGAKDEPDDLLDAYLDALQVQGRSAKTLERYRYKISRLMASVKVNTRGITVYHLRRYLADEKARGISDSTLEGDREVFSAYFNWLHREGLIETNPTANLGTIKCPKRIKKIYTEVDIERLKRACKNVRDRAIICFLLSTGCRISEMTQLNRDDVDLSKLECRVIGKGNKERICYLSPVAGLLIKEYLLSRGDDSPALFIGKGTQRIQPGGVRAALNRVNAAAGVEHVHPHKFRRTAATNLIRHGMPIQEVASILGHEKLDTTMQYVVMDQREIANNYRRYT